MKYFSVILLLFLLSSCGPSEEDIRATVDYSVQIAVEQTIEAIPTQTPYPTLTPLPEPTVDPIPDSFKNQLNELLRATNAVTGATSQGVSYVELRQLVNEARGAYDLTYARWPASVSRAPLADFQEAFEGWDLTLDLWGMELDDKDNPVEPNVNRYREFIEYSDLLILETHPDNFIVPDYRGKQYVSFENIRILMSLGADHFLEGQEKVLDLVD